ncbi:MAG: multicopper oxidase domain-containing protein [Acidobacteriota bacterium]
MSFSKPAWTTPRMPVAGNEAEFVKMFDPQPVGFSPSTPEPLTPTNPVPEVKQALGVASKPSSPHTLQMDLLNGLSITTWDNKKKLLFFTFRDNDLVSPFNAPQYPAPTIRVPRGVVFHGKTAGKGPPPHTIHWHGIEPTPINDGVGHCSMEVGNYVYQWQPNFTGTYFFHCHRNTMQHFNFGLYGLLLIVPPDAYFASIASTNPDGTVVLNNVPVGAGTDGLFRCAANVAQFPQFGGFVGGDPVNGVANGDPHAFTVPYDVEALWVLADRDSTWSSLASDAFATFPAHGDQPGVNDNFFNRPGSKGFFNFNDYRADYWFVTGVPVPAPRGGTSPIANPATVFGTPDGTIPPALNSGVSGTQVAINSAVNKTILIRCLDAAYNWTKVTFPVDVVIIAWDGRALGVPPFGLYTTSYLVPANTPTLISTARRCDFLVRPTVPMNSFVNVDFFDTRGGTKTVTAQIPFNIV